MKTIGKIFIGALVAVGAYALYANWKKKQTGAATTPVLPSVNDVASSVSSAVQSAVNTVAPASTSSSSTNSGFVPVATNPAASTTTAKTILTAKPGYVASKTATYNTSYSNGINDMAANGGTPSDAYIGSDANGYWTMMYFPNASKSARHGSLDAAQGYLDALLKAASLPIGYSSFKEAKAANA